MKYNISKELFEAVMEIKSINPNEFHIDNRSRIISYISDGLWNDITINDFFFKCKEWALEQGYSLNSRSKFDGKGDCTIYANRTLWSADDYEDYTIADSEHQAVFDACQWILEKEL